MKTKIKKVSIKIPEYWQCFVGDYHEFRYIKSIFKEAGLKVKYQEIDCMGDYEAVFWIGKKPVEFIKEREKSYEQEN